MAKSKSKSAPFSGELTAVVDHACQHHRAGVSARLKKYLQHLKGGAGRRAASVHAGLGYQTIQNQRIEYKSFADLEDAAENHADGEVQRNLFNRATSPKASVGHFFAYWKLMRGWKEADAAAAASSEGIPVESLPLETRKQIMADLKAMRAEIAMKDEDK